MTAHNHTRRDFMKKCISLIALLQFAAAGAFGKIPVSDAPVTINGELWNLVWAEEFNYTGKPNPKYWDYERLPPYKNSECQFYTDRLKNVRVENGKLVIEAHLEEWSGYSYNRDPKRREKRSAPYTSGAINTRDRIAFLYGRIEMSAKMPSGGGVWPGAVHRQERVNRKDVL